MNFVDELRFERIRCFAGPSKERQYRPAIYRGAIELALIDLHRYVTVDKAVVRDFYKKYPIDNLWYFDNIILIDHQIPRWQSYYRRIYSLFDDDSPNKDIKLLNFMVDGSAYELLMEPDIFQYSYRQIYEALVRYAQRNGLL